MMLYLSWSKKAANGNRFTRNKILQYAHTTFVNVEELIKEHKVQVDSEIFKVRDTFESPDISSTRLNNKTTASPDN